MNLENLVRPKIKGISPYRPGKPIAVLLQELGIERAIKLASNENPLGPSPQAVKAIAESLSRINIYPEGSGSDLRRALAGLYGVQPDEVILGSGSSEVLALVLLAFLNGGEEVVLPEPTFTIYEILVLVAGGVPVKVPLRPDFSYNLAAMAAAVTDKTKALFLCSPNNPTGTIVPKAELFPFLKSLPEDVIVVLDEAYAEYAETEEFASGIGEIRRRPLLIARTFSKMYGLAALRIGYGIADAGLIAELNKIRPPFNTTVPAQVGAAAVLKDKDYLERSFENNRSGKRFLYRGLAELKVAYVPTEANFILVDLKDDAPEISRRLEKRGVIVRPLDNPALRPRYLRVTIGTPEENSLFLESLSGALV